MHIITTNVHPNEPCEAIAEGRFLRQQPDGSTQWRWMQYVWVYRDDTIAKWERDLGPAENFDTATPFRCQSFGEDSVAEMQDMAENSRRDDYWHKRSIEMQEASTLLPDIVRQQEILYAIAKNRSTFGPYQSAQRNS